MMFITISIFAVSMIAVFAFIGYGSTRMSRGEVTDVLSRKNDVMHLFTPLFSVLHGKRLPYSVKRTYALSLSTLKRMGRDAIHYGIHRARQSFHAMKKSMDDRDPGIKNRGASSLYLKDITEHKKKIVKENGYHPEEYGQEDKL